MNEERGMKGRRFSVCHFQ